ncbi:MAG: phenylalanine--tRNA ligase subunit beta [Gammaproteobacteria bacterium]|nr:phenylalanine--tRNA ligase subunit beta [Gammaproteobacteria bacterium]MDH4312787.1 phenylalanine--tRNA ligase subunit beta [Gammaproteobacteria bacterium]
MRVSLQWLSEWIGGPLPAPKDLAAGLTMAGLEIEGVEPAAPPLPGVIVGEIVERVKHPNADTLSVCQVSTGAEIVQIVCGAPNARAGMKAPLATVGARLPGGMEIRKAMLRGVESLGMLCSARELALSEDSVGLLELPADAPTGATLTEALGLDDTILDVNLTPNRGDCMSVLGIAREVAALTGQPLTGPAWTPVPAASRESFPVELTAGAGCVRFASRVIRGLDPQARSPAWMQERLRRSGLRPISAAVDVTNYVMLELGQPLHAYDLRELAGGIVVRRARAGEKLKLLDGREIVMDETVLVIADREKSLGLAGVMGGDHSGIGDDTTDVLLEVAFFLPDAIAGRGRRFGLVTDASQRFERGVDPTLQERAIERATALLCACAGGTPGPTQLAELAHDLPRQASVQLRPERARRVIGADISDTTMASLLTGLGMRLDRGDSAWRVTPPTWRFDIAIEEDLIEEIARTHGFDRIPETVQPARQAMPALTETRVQGDAAADILVQRGYFEAITYSFIEPLRQALFSPGAVSLTLSNPISAELATMRASLWPGLAAAVASNQRRQQPRVRLFEVGRKFLVDEARSTLHEVPVIAGIAAGSALPEQWGAPRTAVDFFDVRADVEALLRATVAADEFRFVAGVHPALDPGQTAEIRRRDRHAGWIGRLHPEVERQVDLTYSGIVFELELDVAMAAAVPHFHEVSRFPAVRRDLAIVVEERVPVQKLLDCVQNAAGTVLRDTTVFDIYRGAGIETGCKSVAIGLNLQDVSRTLTDDETDAVVARVVSDLERECSATIRDR